MLLRIRWFLMGAAAAVSGGAYLAARVRRARQRFTARSAGRAAALATADLLEGAGRRLAEGRPGAPD
jgi:hypothetical protein